MIELDTIKIFLDEDKKKINNEYLSQVLDNKQDKISVRFRNYWSLSIYKQKIIYDFLNQDHFITRTHKLKSGSVLIKLVKRKYLNTLENFNLKVAMGIYDLFNNYESCYNITINSIFYTLFHRKFLIAPDERSRNLVNNYLISKGFQCHPEYECCIFDIEQPSKSTILFEKL